MLFAAACGSGGGGAAGDDETIQIASNSNASALTTWVAIDEGIFKKHDLDVEYTKVENVGTLPRRWARTSTSCS